MKKKTSKTKYRTISDGFTEFLQYKGTFLWIIPCWIYIPYPCIEIMPMASESCICLYNTNFKEFIKKYPNINQYASAYDKEQKELKDGFNKRWEERQERKKQKHYFQ